MAEATAPQTDTNRKVGRWALIKEMFAEMDRLHAQMKQDRVEIDRLASIIRVNIEETKAALDRISAS